MTLSRIKAEFFSFDWHDLKNIETIGNWPLLIRVIVLLVAFLLCVVLGYQLTVNGMVVERASLMEEETALRHELEQKSLIVAGLTGQRASTLSSEEELTQLLRQIPSEKNVPELVDGITAVGHESRLMFSRVDLGEEQVREFYIEQSLNMEVFGSYHDFATFLSGLADLPGLVTLHDFSIERRRGGKLGMTLTLQSYRHESGKGNGQKMGRITGARYTGVSLRSPFDEMGMAAAAKTSMNMLESGVVPDVARPMEPLESFALSTLHMVGMIAHGPTIQALVRDGNGVVHRVAVGQHMGHDYGRVERITATQIELMELVQSGDGWLQRPKALLLQQQSCRPECEGGEGSGN